MKDPLANHSFAVQITPLGLEDHRDQIGELQSALYYAGTILRLLETGELDAQQIRAVCYFAGKGTDHIADVQGQSAQKTVDQLFGQIRVQAQKMNLEEKA